jgi:hypothetical protein
MAKDYLQASFIFPLTSLFVVTLFLCLVNIGYAMFVLASTPLVFCCKHVLGSNATISSAAVYEKSNSRLLGKFQNLVGISKTAKVLCEN